MMIAARPAAVLFDMDGLLLDTEALLRDAMIAEMADRGFAMDHADFAALVGLPEAAVTDVMAARFGPALDYPAMRAALRQRVWRQWGPHRPVKPGVERLLALLAEAGIPRAVVTSTDAGIARDHLGHAGLIDHFGLIIGGDDVVRGKPDPEPYRAATRALNLPPEACLALEDSHNGVRAAHGAGVPVIMVPDLLPATAAMRALVLAVAADLDMVADWLAAAS